jgi:UDP-3-O-[3-hydroxymyristoyl] glucosamine N-acyltransferase
MDIRLKVISELVKRGATFINLIHNTARTTNTSRIGKGCIVGPFVSIGADSVIEDYCILQTGSIVGHDARIGTNSRIDNYSILVAGVMIEKNCTIHSNSVINANITVGEGAIVGACSFVIRDVKSGSSIFGNPAKRLF